MDVRFIDTVAIVTGSSSGIGKATALRLAREGAAVCVSADRNVEGGQQTVSQIEADGGRAVFVQADVAAAEGCGRIVETTLDAFGRVDVLVNNAGITRGAPLEEFDAALWDQILDTNLKSAFLLSRGVIPDMLKRGRGSVINVSSVHAVASRPRHAAYAASKAGMCGMTRALAVEFGDRGIRFNCLLPGTIDLRRYPRRGPEPDGRTWRPRESTVQTMKRLGDPDEIAAAICFLASDESSFVNGAVLTADGGLLCKLGDLEP